MRELTVRNIMPTRPKISCGHTMKGQSTEVTMTGEVIRRCNACFEQVAHLGWLVKEKPDA